MPARLLQRQRQQRLARVVPAPAPVVIAEGAPASRGPVLLWRRRVSPEVVRRQPPLAVRAAAAAVPAVPSRGRPH
jgi:hypothetical protein